MAEHRDRTPYPQRTSTDPAEARVWARAALAGGDQPKKTAASA